MPKSFSESMEQNDDTAGLIYLPRVPLASSWFAVYTSPRHEKRVAHHFGQRQIENFLPLYRSRRQWRDGSKVVIDLPLFPSYVFVNLSSTRLTRVLEVPGVLQIVRGPRGVPAPVPDFEIDALASGMHEHHAEPHPLLTEGERARIRSGAFAGFEGVVQRVKNSLRVVLTMNLIMQSISIEVNANDLEPTDSKGAR